MSSPFTLHLLLSSPVCCKHFLLHWELLQSRAVETLSWMTEKSANGVKHNKVTESLATFRSLHSHTTCSNLLQSISIQCGLFTLKL